MSEVLYVVCCTKASLSDDDGLLAMIRVREQDFLAVSIGLMVTIMLDNGYHKEYLEPELAHLLKFELAEKITPSQCAAVTAHCDGETGICGDEKVMECGQTNVWINQ